MLKKVFKFILILFIYVLLNSVSFSLLPFSADFKAQNMASGPSSLPFVLISTCWIVFTIIYLIDNSKTKGIKSILYTILAVFVVQSVLTQLETLFFGSSFKGLLNKDIMMIVIAGLIPITLSAIAAAVLFKQKKESNQSGNDSYIMIDAKKSIISILVIGIVYVIIYFSFGYFVAWRFEAVRIFYSGSALDSSFIDKLIGNWNSNPIIYLFQYFRGILFACCALIILIMKWKQKYMYILSVCLVYLCSAIVLIIPNFLFPDQVRWAHFLEMSSSMFLFALITSLLLWKCRKVK